MPTDLRSNATADADPVSSPPENRSCAPPIEARFYRKLEDNNVLCTLCPRACVVRPGRRGHCRVRENRAGAFYTLVHSRVAAAHIDPIEKKPLFHYLPGTTALSIGTAGCNVSCKFCQNWSLSQSTPEQIHSTHLPPGRAAILAQQARCPTIAFTYNEPTVFAEYVIDTAEAAHQLGVRSIVVSNGYIQPEALRAVYGKADAVKIDLKAFTGSFYTSLDAGRLKPVLDTLVALRHLGTWFEIVYLVIPTLNDGDKQILALAQWIKTNLGAAVPLHFTQFHPDYQMKHLPATPVSTLERAKAIADAEGLNYVYIGNVPGHPAQNTSCPLCHKILVTRTGFTATNILIRSDGSCPDCRHSIPGIWHA